MKFVIMFSLFSLTACATTQTNSCVIPALDINFVKPVVETQSLIDVEHGAQILFSDKKIEGYACLSIEDVKQLFGVLQQCRRCSGNTSQSQH